MTIELTNLPFKHNGLDDDIDMEALAMQMNAIEPGAGNIQETTVNLAPQLMGTDSGVILMVIAGLAVLSVVITSLIKHSPKLKKIR